MGLFSRSYFALLRRNLLYRKCNPIGSFLELALPVGFICILVAIKVSLEDTDGFSPETIEPEYPRSDNSNSLPHSFHDYVVGLQAQRICFDDPESENSNDMSITGYNRSSFFGFRFNFWPNPFVKCDSRACDQQGDDARMMYCEYPVLAVAPETKSTTTSSGRGRERMVRFRDYVYGKYPALNDTDLTPQFARYSFVKEFDDERSIERYVKADAYGTDDHPKIGLAVIFQEGRSEKDYAYKLRVNSTNFNEPENEARPGMATTPPTDKLFDNLANVDEACVLEDGTSDFSDDPASCTMQYASNGFLAIQRLLGDWILHDTGAEGRGYQVAEHGVQFISFPTRQYVQDGFYSTISGFAPLLVMLGLLYPVASIIRALTLEKQLRQKELMKMMSVTESDIGWSWFTSFGLLHFVSATLSAIATSALYANSEIALLWFFWFFSFMAVIVYSFVCSAFFTKATLATLLGMVSFFCGYFLTLAADFETGDANTIALVSLHPVAAIAYGIQEIGRLEDAGVGVTASTFNTTDSVSGYTFQNTLSNLIVDCVFWGVVSWYANRVAKSELGQPLPWYFPFSASYWCPNSTGRGGNAEGAGRSSDASAAAGGDTENVPVEPVSDTLTAQLRNEGKGIEIVGLKKEFGSKTAVDGLSLSMYTGQITALLGHNGAGKTTTISMLTGMLSPTSGHAVVAGKDIRTDMTKIRQEIGICLQHDCIFPQLTVEQHLVFFARLKGMFARCPRQEAMAKIRQSMEDVALLDKRNTPAGRLSGGMKRKLSVAVAFCGDSKTVLLDEPTSGMDPFSRRFTWNVIRQYRQDRCIILTTHFMDEADVLGDRIAIMAEGQLRCAGSSLFLKKYYGVGYQLTIEKQSRGMHSSEHGHAEPEYTDGDPDEGMRNDQDVDDKLTDIVMGSVKEAALLSNVGTEMSFQLPIGASSEFTSMFEGLDDAVDHREIVTYGVSITTLDEVFLLIARGGSGEKVESLKSSRRIGADAVFDDEEKTVGSAKSALNLSNENLFAGHVKVLLQKRALNFKRDKKAWCCTTLLPSFAVLAGILIFKYAAPTRNFGALPLTLEDYNEGVTNGPRNPIPFNEAGDSFQCQPALCWAYPLPFILGLTGESYTYCGAGFFGELKVEEIEIPTECEITESGQILDTLRDFGAAAEGVSGVFDVDQASRVLPETAKEFEATQYGAIFFTHDNGTDNGYYEAAVGACELAAAVHSYLNESFCENYRGIGYTVRYNYTALHSAPLYQSLADQAIVRHAMEDDDFTISPTVHPLPITSVEKSFGQAEDAFTAWFLLILTFPFIAGSFATFVVSERASKAKHLQTVAGVKPTAYWLSSYFWDILNYQLPAWITIILMFAFDIETFTTTKRGILGGTIISILLFGPAAAGFTYCLSFAFKSASLANLVVIILNFLLGLAGPLVTFILRLIGSNPGDPNENLVSWAKGIEWCLRTVPSFNLSNSLFKIINIETLEFLAAKEIDIWHHTAILNEVFLQAVSCVVYIILAIWLDILSNNPRAVSFWNMFVDLITCRCFGSGPKDTVPAAVPEDEDVIAEIERVASGGANDDLIVLNQLTKQYSNGKVAVNGLSFGIPPGECFGLLGINGAGKTTTMEMLTAAFPPTNGDATLAGYSVKNEPEKTRRRIGYCPQFDAHFTNMTGREHVALYAAIKGVASEHVKDVVMRKLKEVGLSEADSDRLSAGYSGGMKRKLSVACATIGNPQIVFLDEPSTGMDPVARRDMWQVISDMVTGGNVPDEEKTSVILTTHSMEECEALCARLGIMANAQLRCLGSAQHLKTRFGQGYQVQMKLSEVTHEDGDYLETYQKLGDAVGMTGSNNVEAGGAPGVYLNVQLAKDALASVTGDDTLSSLLSPEDPTGYPVYTAARSPTGVGLEELVSFAVSEMRIKNVAAFFSDNFSSPVLRERQFSNVRYEVSAEGMKISTIFALIEQNKDVLHCSDYGVSQTSLEQVFNMHAAEAEKAKHGRNDR